MIYSIGHGAKELDKFLAELKAYGIEYLLDVRSKPYSKMHPQFNQNELKATLREHCITYAFMGDKLGGLPHGKSYHTEEGKVDYQAVSQKESFQAELKRLLSANEQNLNVAVMCSEGKPETCHRSKLIGHELLKRDVVMQHILDEERVKDQFTVMLEATKGKGAQTLFEEDVLMTSRGTYA